MLIIDQAQNMQNGNKMKKRATKTNNTGPICTSRNQEGANMYVMVLTIKITEIHQTDSFYLKNNFE